MSADEIKEWLGDFHNTINATGTKSAAYTRTEECGQLTAGETLDPKLEV